MTPRKKPKPHRSDWAEDWRDQFLSRISDGRSMRDVCKDGDMPGRTFVFAELEADDAFAGHYARACDERADAMFEDMLSISDDGTNDTLKREDGSDGVNMDHIQRSRLRIETRKWMLGKMRPKKYGPKVTVDGKLEVDGLSALIGEIQGGE